MGRGAFSTVRRTLHRLDGCVYAVKITRRKAQSAGEARELLQEAQALAAAGGHPHIVRYHAAWIEADQLHLQLEYCPGGSLGARLRAGYTFSEGELLGMLQQVGGALAHLHGRGVAHLDVKPDNILLAADGSLRLGDFGLAVTIDGRLGMREGDARYLPTEALNADARALDRVDMFSLGISAYELARGRELPSSGAPYSELRAGKAALLPGFTVSFQNLVKNLLHPDPAQRLTAPALLRALQSRSPAGRQPA